MPRTITSELRGSALWITLARPDALNSLSPEMVAELIAAFDAADRDRTLRAVVLTGAGRAFCAGADLKAVQSMGGPDEDPARATARFLDEVRRLMTRIERLRLPVIAAVNGLALAGGLELVLCCDLVVAADSARLGDAHAKYGLLPGGGASARLPRKIGPTRAKYMMFTAEHFTAAELREWGLVTEIAPAAELYEAVERLLRRIVDKSPIGLERMKRLVDDSLDQPLEVALGAERVMSELHAHSRDRAEGLAAFIEKRQPRYTGS
jgi:enoyl-CoA hydratase/carnithine racemase